MPIGTEMIEAIATITSVPRMALPKPPPGSMPAGGSSVKSSSPRRCPPWPISIQSTEKSGTAASSATSHSSTVRVRFRNARRSQRLRRRSGALHSPKAARSKSVSAVVGHGPPQVSVCLSENAMMSVPSMLTIRVFARRAMAAS